MGKKEKTTLINGKRIKLERVAYQAYLEGLTPKEISKKYKISIGTVKSWMHKNQWHILSKPTLAKPKKSVHEYIQERMEESAKNISDITRAMTMICKRAMAEIAQKVSQGENVEAYARQLKDISQILKPYADLSKTLFQQTEQSKEISTEEMYLVLSKEIQKHGLFE